jgi:hypothetical protein
MVVTRYYLRVRSFRSLHDRKKIGETESGRLVRYREMRRFLNPAGRRSAWSAGSSGKDVAEFALSGSPVESVRALRAKFEILQPQYCDAVLPSDHRPMNDHFQRE